MGYYTWFSMQARNIKSKEEYESIVQALKDKEIYEREDTCGVFAKANIMKMSMKQIFQFVMNVNGMTMSMI